MKRRIGGCQNIVNSKVFKIRETKIVFNNFFFDIIKVQNKWHKFY